MRSKQHAMGKYTLYGGWSHRAHPTLLPVACFVTEDSTGICQISELNC